jgi:hypothetical protein
MAAGNQKTVAMLGETTEYAINQVVPRGVLSLIALSL